jgi:hypothetical protein
VSSFIDLFGWLPGHRSTVHTRARIQRSAVAALGFVLAELGVNLNRLAELSETTQQGDAAAIDRAAGVTAQVLDGVTRGNRLVLGVTEEEVTGAWRRLDSSVAEARAVEQGRPRAVRLREAAAECERLQELVDAQLGRL